MATTTLSQKYQIVVPLQVRQKLRLSAGMKVALYPLDDSRAVLVKEPASPLKALKGLGKDVWETLGGSDAYIQQERSSWQASSV